MALSHVLSSPIADFTGTVTVFNSAGATTTANATQIVRPSDWNSAHNEFVTLSGNTAGVSTLSGTNIVLQGGNNIVLSGNGQSIIISASAQSVQTQSTVAVQGSTGAISFANSNGITFGGNASTITASHNGLTTAALSNHSHGVSFTSGSVAFQTLSFTNSNGISFNSGTQGIFGSHNAITTGRASNDGLGLNTAATNVTWTANSAGVSINAAGYAGTGFTSTTTAGTAIVATQGTNGLSMGVPAFLTVAGGGGLAISGGAESRSTGTVNFSNANGVTFGLSNNGVMTASVAAVGGAQTGISGIGVSNTTYTSGTVIYSAQANVTLNSSVDGASQYVRISGNAAQSVVPGIQSIQVSNTTYTTGNVIFSNANGVSFGSSAGGAITASYTVPTQSVVPGIQTIAFANTTFTTGAVSFSNANGISFGSSGAQVTASHNALTSQSNQGASASNGAFTFQTLNFSNANNVTFGTSAGGIITASVAAGGGGGAAISAGANSQSTGTVNFANSNGITFGLSNNGTMTASYNSTQFAGQGTTTAGANISLSMTINSVGLNVSASVAAPGAAAEANAINMLGANTAGNTTATGSTIGWSGVNVTLSGTNASQIVISAPATSSLVGASGISISTNGSTISVYPIARGNLEIYELRNNTAFSTMGQNTIYLQQFIAAAGVTFDNIERRFSGSSVSSTNSQVAAHTYRYGLYSKGSGGSTSIYSQIGTSSMYFAASFNSNTAAGWTISQGAGSVTNTSAGTANLSAITGFKHVYFPFAGTVTEGGQYAIAMQMSSATTVGTSPLRIGMMEMTNINNLTIGRIDTAAGFSISNASRLGEFAQGVYSATSSNLPSTIALSGLTNAVSQARMYLQLD